MRQFGKVETRIKLTENAVEAQIAKFLHGLGWRRQRNHVGRFRTENGARVAVGVAGYPDWTYRRTIKPGMVEILHVETKASTGRASAKQLEAIASLNHIGEPACVAAGLEEFVLWYREQGFTPDWKSMPVNVAVQKPVVDFLGFRVAV